MSQSVSGRYSRVIKCSPLIAANLRWLTCQFSRKHSRSISYELRGLSREIG